MSHCDQCGNLAMPYHYCIQCLDDVCLECMPDADPETARGVCLNCQSGQDEDHRLDDPRHGQAAAINRENRGRG